VAPDGATAQAGPYGSDGPSAGTKVTVSVTGAPNSPFDAVVYVPSGAGPFPVVVFSSGALQNAAGYALYGKRLASWGILAILRDDPVSASVDSIVADVSYVVGTWLAAQNTTAGSPLLGKVDAAKVGLAGHSRGGRISLLAAEGAAKGKVKGVFGLDPVDDRAPYSRTTLGTIGVPVAFVGETVDSTGTLQACAPAASNYQILYQAASAPAVAITAVGANHPMFVEPASCVLCGFCNKGTADQTVVLGYSSRYLTAFFARELKGDTQVGAAFEGAGAAADVSSGAISIVSK
jgi:dienelactone hydrolase